MAMFEQFYVDNAALKDAFHAAASAGDKYLLVMEHTIGGDIMVTSAEYTRAVKNAGDIVPMLRQLNARLDLDDIHRVTAVYDLTRDFNRQATTRDTTALPPQTLREIEQYKKSYDLARRQKEWDQKSFIEKIFVTRPF